MRPMKYILFYNRSNLFFVAKSPWDSSSASALPKINSEHNIYYQTLCSAFSRPVHPAA